MLRENYVNRVKQVGGSCIASSRVPYLDNHTQMFQKATTSATPTLASDNPPDVQLSVRLSSLLQHALSSHVLCRLRCTLENHLPVVWHLGSKSSRPLARILKVRVNGHQHQLNLFKTLPGVMVILLTPSATLLVADARACLCPHDGGRAIGPAAAPNWPSSAIALEGRRGRRTQSSTADLDDVWNARSQKKINLWGWRGGAEKKGARCAWECRAI